MSLRWLGTYKQRLLVLIVMLISVAQGTTIVLALSYLRVEAQRSGQRELSASEAMLLRELRVRQERMQATAEVLVSDFGFKAAVASRDPNTIRSALLNHAERIGASLAILYGDDGHLIASTAALPAALSMAPTSADDASEPLLYAYHTVPMQFAVTSVRAPEPIAQVAFGFPLDAAVEHQLSQLVGMDVRFAVASATGAATRNADTPSAAVGTASAQPSQPAQLRTQPQSLSLITALPARSGQLQLIQNLPLGQVMAGYRSTRGALSAIAILALAGAVLIAWLAGRSAARPVEQLARAARRIEAGNFEPVTISGAEEFTHLARSFNSMQAGLREREERIRHQSLHDSLTGLLNRVGLREQLGELLGRGASVTLLRLDLHRFRDLNASMDRRSADEVLCAVASSVQRVVGAEEYAARLSADQFALLLNTNQSNVAERTALALIESLRDGVLVGERRVLLTARAGISTADPRTRDADDLMRRADFALMEAKEHNIALARYEAAHDAEHQRGLLLVNELRRAILDDQLTVAYQPLVQVTDGAIEHFEALVRWTHPSLGSIPPGDFVPLAERSALIGELTRWVIGAVLEQLRVWQQSGFRGSVAINLSAVDVTDRALPQFVLQRLAASGVAAERLIFEVTESAIMRDLQAAVSVMQQLRAMGIRFALDDFGTGHASLAQLHTLPLDALKIDGSFVRELGRSERSLVIVRSTTELGHGLGLRVVAEGVETAAGWAELVRVGCDYAQGYLISRPLPAAQVPGWLQEHREAAASQLSRANQNGELIDFGKRRAKTESSG